MPNSERLTLTIPEAAALLGMSRNLAYRLARRNELPVRVILLGEKRMVVSKQAIMALLEDKAEVITDGRK